jgi:hypothetical protein
MIYDLGAHLKHALRDPCDAFSIMQKTFPFQYLQEESVRLTNLYLVEEKHKVSLPSSELKFSFTY